MGEDGGLRILPYGDPWKRIARTRLESVADDVVGNSSLITRVARADPPAMRAYFVGGWPFVSPFSSSIYSFKPPLRRLIENLGADRARACLAGIRAVFADMSAEEGEHAGLWAADARAIGIHDLDSPTQRATVPAVEELIERARSKDPVVRLSLLSGTEGVAEALSRRLTAARPFTDALGGRYRWGEAHLMAHSGPSHYQVDLALLEACLSKGTPNEQVVASIESQVVDVLYLFERATQEVEQAYCPRLAARSA
jgi:hypothetical protein